MKKMIAVLAFVVVALAVAAVFVYTRPAKVPRTPHVVFIVVDTLRADHVGAYGYTRAVTPNIDALASAGTLFENVYPPTSWTVPSMATLFTGLWPQDHGIIQGLQILGQIAYQHQLGDAHDTLAERMKSAGYLTLGYSTNVHITRTTGFGQGFDDFREATSANADYVDELVTKDLPRLNEAVRNAQPYFLYLHFFDPHTPYLPREPWIKQIAPDLDEEILLDVNPNQGDLMGSFPRGFFSQNPRHLQVLKDVYDSEVAAVDASIGSILGKLPGLEDAYVVFVSDHGEAFSEHDTMLHGYDLFEGTTRVPLIVRGPSSPAAPHPLPVAAGARVSTPVDLTDVMPTILSLGGVSASGLPGLNLLKELPAVRDFPLHLHRGPIQAYGVVRYPWKVIIDKFSDVTMYFNVANDPLEKNNLYPATPIPDDLVAAAAKADEIHPRIPTVLVRNQHVANEEQLKSLGYLSGTDDKQGEPAASPVPEAESKPWVIELGVCDRVKALKAQCDKAPEATRAECVDKGLAAIRKDACPKASSFNYKKKCEFMRLDPTLRQCEKAAE